MKNTRDAILAAQKIVAEAEAAAVAKMTVAAEATRHKYEPDVASVNEYVAAKWPALAEHIEFGLIREHEMTDTWLVAATIQTTIHTKHDDSIVLVAGQAYAGWGFLIRQGYGIVGRGAFFDPDLPQVLVAADEMAEQNAQRMAAYAAAESPATGGDVGPTAARLVEALIEFVQAYR